MAENSLIDIFDLCWDAILKESMYYSNTLFSDKNCSSGETRDTNFDLVENRLAYMYKFGCFNTILVQKCVESFLDKCSEKELFLGDLKVCSLSNGPGFDLLGFFCGIYKSNQNLKNLPVFKIINLYNSWWTICQRIFIKVFKAVSESSNLNIPPEIIHFMQCDIYSALCSDVKECIKDSDILLMVNVFSSTKATSDVVIKSMQEIFSYLKPGSFVFFVGSKKNTKELTSNNLLGNFVNCILGPIKISVTDLPVNEAVVKSVNVKPKTSGYAYFIVWQQKDLLTVLIDNVPKKKRKKKKSNIQVQKESTESTVLLKQIDDTDESSETYSSHSKKSETSYDDFQLPSCEKMFEPVSPAEIHFPHLGKEEQNRTLKNSLSVGSITSLLDKIHLDSKKDLIAVMGITESEESICIPEKNSEAKLENYLIDKDVIVHTQNDLLNEINYYKQTDVEMMLNEVSYKPKSQLMESNSCENADMKPVLTHHLNKELHSIQKYALPLEENNTFNFNNSNVPVNSFDEKESIQAMQFNIVELDDNTSKLKKNNQIKKSETHILNLKDICSPSNIQQDNCTITANQFSGSEEGTYDEARNTNSNGKKNSVGNLLQVAVLKSVIQTMDDEKFLLDSNTATIKHKSRSKISENKSQEKNLDLNSLKERTPEKNGKTTDLNLLLQRCENLVTSLEKLTANFKNNISLSNDQDTRCCCKKSCMKYKIQQSCVNSCCFNPVHSHCCKKVCNCHVTHHTIYTGPKHFCERAESK